MTFLRHFVALRRNGRLYLISNTIQAVSAGAVGVLYNLYLTALGYDTAFIGLVIFFGVLGAAIALLPAASLVRTLGWRTMLLWSDWVGGVAIVLQLLVPIPLVIFATSLVAGASFAVILIINTPLLTEYSPPESRTAIFGLNSALGLLAAVVGSVLGGVLPDVFRSAPVAHAAPVQFISLVLSGIPLARVYQLAMLTIGATAVPSIIPVFMMRDDERGFDTLAAKDAPARAPTSQGGRTVLRRVGLLGRWLRAAPRAIAAGMPGMLTSVIGRFALTQALLGFGAGLYVQYLNIYFVKQLHMPTHDFGVLAAALMIVQAGTALLSAPLANRLGNVRGPAVALLGSLPFLFLLGVGPTLGIIAFAYLARGACTSMAGPPLQTFLMEAVPTEKRVVASEAFNVSFQIAGALGVVIGGTLIAQLGFLRTFLVASIFYILCAVLLLLWFVRRTFVISKRTSPGTEDEPVEPLISREA